ncbi:MAG: hypothetical protein IKF36_04930 [Bacilli bacterium]|nr:hypothetical protein [Bacilli bacterium]
MIIKDNGMNSNTFDLLLGKGVYKINEESDSCQEDALKAIEAFTLLDDEEQEFLLDSSRVIIKKDGAYFYTVGYRPYMFDRMDKYSNHEVASKLRTKARYKLCCPESIKMALDRKRGNVRIGYIHYSEKKIIHAIYEDDEIVYDFTKNLVMMEQDYYSLTEFEELNVITSNELQSDFKYIESIGTIPLKIYLLYRDEIMKDLKKNNKVLKVNENGKKRSK